MPNPRNFKSHKQMGTCTLVWANIRHPEIHTEKEAAAKFHRKHSPSYTKKTNFTSLAYICTSASLHCQVHFLFFTTCCIGIVTVWTVFPSTYITLKALLYLSTLPPKTL